MRAKENALFIQIGKTATVFSRHFTNSPGSSSEFLQFLAGRLFVASRFSFCSGSCACCESTRIRKWEASILLIMENRRIQSRRRGMDGTMKVHFKLVRGTCRDRNCPFACFWRQVSAASPFWFSKIHFKFQASFPFQICLTGKKEAVEETWRHF